MTGLLFSSIQYLHSDLVMSRATRAIVPTYYVDPSYQVIEHTYRIALIVNDQKLDFLDPFHTECWFFGAPGRAGRARFCR